MSTTAGTPWQIVNRTRGTVLAARAAVARGFVARLVGLMGRRQLAPGAGLLFPGTPWVHTGFMRFPIDLVFYGKPGAPGEGAPVLAVAHALRPWRVSPYCRGARGVAELPAGTAQASGTRPGDALDFVPLRQASGRPDV